MKSTLWWLGLIFGTLSVVMLIKHGFDYGFVAPLQLILGFYEQAMQVLFGWAEPTIKEVLAAIGAWLGWRPELSPSWKHAFLLMMVYFGQAARHAVGGGNSGTAWFNTLWGLFAAAIGSLAVGVFVNPDVSQFAAAAISVCAIAIYDIGCSTWAATWHRLDSESWGEFFVRESRNDLVRAALSLLVAGGILSAPGVTDLPGSGIAAFSVVVFLLAAAWLWLGLTNAALMSAVRSERAEQPDHVPEQIELTGTLARWSRNFRLSRRAQLGGAVVSIFLGTAIFICVNAGLKLAGL